jgi:hypothetical protein
VRQRRGRSLSPLSSDEDDGAALFPGFFLISGQRSVQFADSGLRAGGSIGERASDRSQAELFPL